MADTIGTGDGDNLGAKLTSLRGGSPSHITKAGESHLLANYVLASLLEKMLGKIQSAETSRLRTKDGASPCGTLTSEDTGVVLTGELLVHSIQETDLTATDTHVTSRDILIGTDAAPELKHESLAETHDLRIGLAHGIKIRATLGTAHRKGGEGVLEGLLETEELKHRRSDSLVET